MHLTYIILFYLPSIISCQTNKLPDGFVYLRDVIPDVMIDLRYYSSHNFVGDTIDGYHDEKCIISMKAAIALSEVQNELKSMGYGLKVFDAYRPQRAVDHFVRWAKDLEDTTMKNRYYPEVDKQLLFEEGYISSKSGHTRGSTVDLTLIYLSGSQKNKELDMGTPWDFFSPTSWPLSDDVSRQQHANRLLLRNVMINYGFKPYEAEWWHFTLHGEPFPDTYFNFPVE